MRENEVKTQIARKNVSDIWGGGEGKQTYDLPG